MDAPEPEETNDVMCVVLRKDGSVERKPNGKIEKGDTVPQAGDLYFLGDMGCTVHGHAYTPLLRYTWHLFVSENST
jgi:hypothetical protein